MAYMIPIGTHCQMGACKKLRTHRVYSRINESKGEYCKRHAQERLDDLQATEDMLRARALQSPAERMREHLDTFRGEK